ncbi:hypothetical protein NOCA1130312 [metagenome]|uniref:Uncharacterized protein n=1 Tax=metagenome TaxID=256318 RepID=A0A2P2C7I1_9ZZZZ
MLAGVRSHGYVQVSEITENVG